MKSLPILSSLCLGLACNTAFPWSYQVSCSTRYFEVKGSLDEADVASLPAKYKSGVPLLQIRKTTPIPSTDNKTGSYMERMSDRMSEIKHTLMQTTQELTDCLDHQQFVSVQSGVGSTASFDMNVLSAPRSSKNSTTADSEKNSTWSQERLTAFRRLHFGEQRTAPNPQFATTLLDIIRDKMRSHIYPQIVNAYGVSKELAQSFPTIFDLYPLESRWDVIWIEFVEKCLKRIQEKPDDLVAYEWLTVSLWAKNELFPKSARQAFRNQIKSEEIKSSPFETHLNPLDANLETVQQYHAWRSALESLVNRPEVEKYYPSLVIQHWKKNFLRQP